MSLLRTSASTPALALALRVPGESHPRLSFEEPEKLHNEDLEVLKALAKAHLTERYGRVLLFVERSRYGCLGGAIPLGDTEKASQALEVKETAYTLPPRIPSDLPSQRMGSGRGPNGGSSPPA